MTCQLCTNIMDKIIACLYDLCGIHSSLKDLSAEYMLNYYDINIFQKPGVKTKDMICCSHDHFAVRNQWECVLVLKGYIYIYPPILMAIHHLCKKCVWMACFHLLRTKGRLAVVAFISSKDFYLSTGKWAKILECWSHVCCHCRKQVRYEKGAYSMKISFGKTAPLQCKCKILTNYNLSKWFGLWPAVCVCVCVFSLCRLSCCELGASVWLPGGRQHIHPQSWQDCQVLSSMGLLYLVVLIIVNITVDGSIAQFLIAPGQCCVRSGSLSVLY